MAENGAVILYARVSTSKQDIEHQEENLWEYATDERGIDPARIDVLSDEGTGTHTNRSDYRDMLERVRAGEVSLIITREVTRLGRSMREISENVHEIVEDHGVGLIVTNDAIEVEPGEELSMQEKMVLNVLAWAGELEAKKLRENTLAGLEAAREAGKWVGQPPYGFTTDDDGYLQPDDDYGAALDAIRAVEESGWSHRKASRHTGVPRRTVPNILERKELYLGGQNEEGVKPPDGS